MSEESKAVLARCFIYCFIKSYLVYPLPCRWEARMIRELGEEGFKQHKKDNFARGHRLHRFLV